MHGYATSAQLPDSCCLFCPTSTFAAALVHQSTHTTASMLANTPPTTKLNKLKNTIGSAQYAITETPRHTSTPAPGPAIMDVHQLATTHATKLHPSRIPKCSFPLNRWHTLIASMYMTGPDRSLSSNACAFVLTGFSTARLFATTSRRLIPSSSSNGGSLSKSSSYLGAPPPPTGPAEKAPPTGTCEKSALTPPAAYPTGGGGANPPADPPYAAEPLPAAFPYCEESKDMNWSCCCG
mmetsp:Transcript_10525/g.23778  ORF Transcript_10525/g.23778 Transcript_10525/m.23778 type:complete len:237 (-) Transcript_10525:142-852(-)